MSTHRTLVSLSASDSVLLPAPFVALARLLINVFRTRAVWGQGPGRNSLSLLISWTPSPRHEVSTVVFVMCMLIRLSRILALSLREASSCDTLPPRGGPSSEDGWASLRTLSAAQFRQSSRSVPCGEFLGSSVDRRQYVLHLTLVVHSSWDWTEFMAVYLSFW